MAEYINVVSIRQEPDGRFTATLHITDDNDKILFKREVTASTKTQFKDSIRGPLENYIEKRVRQTQLLSVANEALDELKTELGW